MRLSKRDWVFVKAALWAAERWHDHIVETSPDDEEYAAHGSLASRFGEIRTRLIDHGIGTGDAFAVLQQENERSHRRQERREPLKEKL